MTRTTLHLNLIPFFASFFFTTKPAQAIGYAESALPNFVDFSKSVQNGESNVLRGVYVPNVLALSVSQQPDDKPYYVSNRMGEATQFAIASQYGNTGLLAHNTLSSKLFSGIDVGQEVRLLYGDGRVEYFIVKSILRFQALQPESITSVFRNLARDETLSAGEVFNLAYVRERMWFSRRVLQQTGLQLGGACLLSLCQRTINGISVLLVAITEMKGKNP